VVGLEQCNKHNSKNYFSHRLSLNVLYNKIKINTAIGIVSICIIMKNPNPKIAEINSKINEIISIMLKKDGIKP